MPESNSDRKFNFSAASSKDLLVFGACRPGGQEPKDHEAANDSVDSSSVQQWVDFMKSQGVTRVVNLLEESEISQGYTCDLPSIMKSEFKSFQNIPLKQEGAADKLVAALEDAEANKEKVVVHCWQGAGRVGQALSTWLVRHHGLAPDEAAAEVIGTAAKANASRRVDVAKLTEFVGKDKDKDGSRL